MENMSMQRRLFLAAFICLSLILAQSLLFPPALPPEPATEDVAQGTEPTASESKTEPQERSFAPQHERPQAGTDSVREKNRAPLSHVVANELVSVTLSNSGGGMIRGVEPLAEKYKEADGKGVDFLLLDGEQTLDLDFVGDDTSFLWKPRSRELLSKDDTGIRLLEETDEVKVIQSFSLKEGYEALYEVEVTNKSAQAQKHRLRVRNVLGEAKDSSRYNVHRGLCRTEEDLEDFDRGDVEDDPERVKGGDDFSGVQWTGLDSAYFLMAVLPEGEPFSGCEIRADTGENGGALLVASGIGRQIELAPGETIHYRFGVYLGAKEPERLRGFSAVSGGSSLEEAVDWGYFGSVSEYLGKKMLALLRWFYKHTGIWGVAIIMLTICVKLVLLPLTLKQYRSMRKMREIQPEIEAIRKKYDGDKQKEMAEIQALWKRSGASPLSGCLPMLVQFPVWIALYAMLGTAVELYHEPFLWIDDLTLPDTLYLLPLGMGALMFLQMRIQPQTGDSQQQQIMKWAMPVFFTVMMWFMPSGLGVYIFANLVLSLIQSFVQIRPDKEWNKNTDASANS